MQFSSLKTKKQAGFSLISVTIAAGIMGVISVAVSQLVMSQSQSVSYLEDRLAKVDLKNNLISLLSDSNACLNTLGTLPITASQNITSISNASNDEEFNLSNRDNFDRLKLESFRLENIDVPAAPGSNGRMKMIVNVARQRTGVGGNDLSPIEFNVSVFTDAGTGVISACNALGGNGSISNIVDQINENRKCTGNPPTQRFYGARLPASNTSYDEGAVLRETVGRPCSNNYTIYTCINATWVATGTLSGTDACR